MQLVSALLRLALKLVLIAVGLVFALGLIAVALLSLVWVLLKALLTGRKPALLVTLGHLHQARQQFRRGGFGNRFRSAGNAAPEPMAAEVVDVQAREVRSEPALPKGRGADDA